MDLYIFLTGLTLIHLSSEMAVPRRRVGRSLDELSLPDNATSIRENISTQFSCLGRGYGYYADPDNDCQLFHVCLPLVFSKEADLDSVQTLMWSFICPQETVFNQETFTCTRMEDSIPCEDSTRYYSLNDKFGERPTEKNDVNDADFDQVQESASEPQLFY